MYFIQKIFVSKLKNCFMKIVLFRNKNLFHEINLEFQKKIQLWSLPKYFSYFRKKNISFGRKKVINFKEKILPLVNPIIFFYSRELETKTLKILPNRKTSLRKNGYVHVCTLLISGVHAWK